ncbi:MULTISPECIES: MoxR family ATPase [unclassified Paenibacillus]|uniref:AAA family ATPase n=1 Tax=unclassified Paenibacillus TaxID=185978 RepID=UPI001AE8BF50|nr:MULTISPECIES: MoxR family ATPase [unclassified Paenibacillus]MBP1153798.1 MoxR-like ATPase [Paenibacillus sp. PvP091]MBP1170817.1 MoxR-like ATPase [Paenibacillus sp. PvR098]MBP2441845.1 MoxR-like ATPase [Paenibacillus sp. PvP052]
MIETREQVEEWGAAIAAVKEQIGRVIVGQQDVVEQLLWCIFAGGHALLEGIPGLGKTMLVRTVADALDMSFSRIQFTPDLMPSDITGTNVIQFGLKGETSYQFQPGPIFGNLVLADEINRATPKTQSALLEAMQEKTVTIGTETHRLPKPFFVLATQNPLENEGTYPLPEAQLDRFLLKINVSYPSRDELKEIVRRTTASQETTAEKTADAAALSAIQQGAKEILLAEDVLDYAVQLMMMTHPGEQDVPDSVKQYVRFGSGPRGLQSIISVAKVRALIAGRLHVSVNDIQKVAVPALRHRIFLNFEGQALGVGTDAVIEDILTAMEKRR